VQLRKMRQLFRAGETELLKRLNLLDIEVAFLVAGNEVVSILNLDYESSSPIDFLAQFGTCPRQCLRGYVEVINRS